MLRLYREYWYNWRWRVFYYKASINTQVSNYTFGIQHCSQFKALQFALKRYFFAKFAWTDFVFLWWTYIVTSNSQKRTNVYAHTIITKINAIHNQHTKSCFQPRKETSFISGGTVIINKVVPEGVIYLI